MNVDGWRERRLIYMALIIACSVVAMAAGPLAGFWSFVQVAAIIELTCRIGTHRADHWRYRE